MNQQDAFDALYADWLEGKSKQASELPDDVRNQLTEEVLGIEHKIMSAPATGARQIACKLNVLREYIIDGSEWTDGRNVRMLGSIEADIAAL
ncbi:MAG: hypothetical protein H6905_06890 [Hyphomicrobiales bacterium]|nr:hypothetical protein [Hyphomicrobiales bacterium]